MPDYRRAYQPGGSFFFTVVTYERAPFLCQELSRRLLRDAIDACRATDPFTIDAFVLLPDHLHTIWTLPRGDGDFSRRWGRIKKAFSSAWRAHGGSEGEVSESRRRNRRAGIWQRRFWEHTLRDETDFARHLDYIHYNPVKHGLASCPHDWPYSSFQKALTRGDYMPAWCCRCEGRIVAPPDFGGIDQQRAEQAFGE